LAIWPECRPALEATGAPAGHVAVRDEGAVPRHAHLATVGVTGEGQLAPVHQELIEDPRVRRVGDPHVQQSALAVVRGEGVKRTVRVVDSHEGDVVAGHREAAPGIVQVQPAPPAQRVREFPRGQVRHGALRPPRGRGEEVGERVAEGGPEVVVRAEHEHAGDVEEGVEGVEDDGE